MPSVPEKFSKWCERNAEKLDLARENGKLPYFVRNNQKIVDALLGWEEKQATKPMSSREKILAAAKARHEARTDKQINDILRRWDYHRRKNKVISNYKNNNDTEFTIGKGKVIISKFVNPADNDFDKLTQVAEHFARNGNEVTLTPKMSRPPKFLYEEYYSSLIGTKYEGKCPDILVRDIKRRIDVWYEHEGFLTDNPKRALKNMLNDGLKQASHLILDRPNLTDNYILHNIIVRQKQGQDIQEVWLRTEDKISLIYKKRENYK